RAPVRRRAIRARVRGWRRPAAPRRSRGRRPPARGTPMKIGLFALGLGGGAHPDVVREAARAAERAGVATLWAAEHVVLFDRYRSAYPYSATGAFPLGADADWLDPFVALSFVAAVTERIRLATGICLVPEHNPLILAKAVASLDRLARGRFAL